MTTKEQPKQASRNSGKLNVVGRWARLIQLPDGCTSSAYNLTIGDCYLIDDVEGSNVWLRTDDGLVSIWRGRVEIL